MSKFTEPISNLIQGVTRQTPANRLMGQLEEQVNMISSVSKGLTDRLPLEVVARLRNTPVSNNTFVKLLDRDDSAKYRLLLGNGFIEVYNELTGAAEGVLAPDGLGYLNNTNPQQGYRILTLADTTFIVNTSRTARMLSSPVAPSNGSACLFFVQGVSQRSTYRIFIDNVIKASYAASSTDGADQIASQLKDQLITNLGAGWTVQFSSHVIYLKKDDGTSFMPEVAADGSGTFLKVIRNKVQNFSDLPVYAKQDYIVQVVGGSGESTGYYVKFDTEGSAGVGPGNWVECPKPGLRTTIDATTMPHQLVRDNTTGTWTFSQVSWVPREVGDNTTAPEPSFINKRITHIYIHKGRMGFLTDNSFLLSQAGEVNYKNYFKTSARLAKDDDPIDRALPTSRVTNLTHAVSFQGDLYLFAKDGSQFIVTNDGLLTNETLNIKQITSYSYASTVSPVVSGSNLTFLSSSEGDLAVREMYIDTLSEERKAPPNNEHVRGYMQPEPYQLVAADSENMVLLVTSAFRNRIYVNKYFWDGNTKAQNSWSYWEFDPGITILAIEALRSTLYVCFQTSQGVFIGTMRISPYNRDPGLPFKICLDMRIRSTFATSQTYDSLTDKTTVVLPFTFPPGATPVFVHPTTADLIPSIQSSPTAYLLNGDTTAVNWYAGLLYYPRWRPGQLFRKVQQNTNGSLGVEVGTTIINKVVVFADKTPVFQVKISDPGGYYDPITEELNNWLLGSQPGVFGSWNTMPAVKEVSCDMENTDLILEVVNPGFVPATYKSMVYNGQYLGVGGRN